MIKSSWELTKAKSQYHFDTGVIDPRWDTVLHLGKFIGDWDKDLQIAIDTSTPVNWETRGYRNDVLDWEQPELEIEEYDLITHGADPKMILSNLNYNLPKVFQNIANCFAMTNVMSRIHVQQCGEVWNLHIDKLQKWNPVDPSQVIRVFVQLLDWQPGQFWEFGNYHWNHWKKGDAVTFDWQNVPHCTANAGYHPRCTLQITGVRTSKTTEFLEKFKEKQIWQV